ncbi:aromatic-ring hydroxylase C-terminal domain-containing protein [Gluconobacter cerinus]|uniref:Uncharacterized protein n=1 Tax=Gluconobacter cerinus TaxID=38307 RepID=A0AAV5NHM9_9PROT|nr:hypothetical protein [Gluconobacter cerinus]GBQ96116.1 hypothetical protein AA0229_0276 [Gluconobacter cerinus NRIC 0229]GLQ63912.1 hypothetical protein GCM10007867_27580 [Gluconobacter cerinus]
MLDTYEIDWLPVIRNVLAKTEELSNVVESNNMILRHLGDHIGPFIAGFKQVQDTAALQMNELSISYRDTPLSASKTHSGDLRTGDRMPDLLARHQDNGHWKEVRLIDILDPSRFTLLVSQDNDETVNDNYFDTLMEEWGDLIRIVRIKPPSDADTALLYNNLIGQRESIFLVRPDGYIGIIVGRRNAAEELTSYYKSWFSQKA